MAQGYGGNETRYVYDTCERCSKLRLVFEGGARAARAAMNKTRDGFFESVRHEPQCRCSDEATTQAGPTTKTIEGEDDARTDPISARGAAMGDRPSDL